MKVPLAVPSVLVLVLSAPLACAQQTSSPSGARATTSQDQSYTFSDDLLNGGALDGSLAMLRVRTKPMRTLLIRPRTQFVTEMLKTADDL